MCHFGDLPVARSSRKTPLNAHILSFFTLSHTQPLHYSYLNIEFLHAELQANLGRNKANTWLNKFNLTSLFLYPSPLGRGVLPKNNKEHQTARCAHIGDSTADREFDSNVFYFLILIKTCSILVCTHFTWFFCPIRAQVFQSSSHQLTMCAITYDGF